MVPRLVERQEKIIEPGGSVEMVWSESCSLRDAFSIGDPVTVGLAAEMV